MEMGYAQAETAASVAAQTDALRTLNCIEVFSDLADSNSGGRPSLEALKSAAVNGDKVVVTRLGRLGCTATEAMRTVLEFDSRGVAVRAADIGLDTSTSEGRMVISVLATLVEWEQETKTTDHQPRPVGRPRSLSEEQVHAARDLILEGRPIALIAGSLGVSASTIQRLKKNLGVQPRKMTAIKEINMSTTEARMMELAQVAAEEVAGGVSDIADISPERTAEDRSRTSFRLGELFCGPGGIGIGAKNARANNPSYRFVHQWANDYDQDTCRTYGTNVLGDPDDPSVVHGDIRTLDYEALKKLGEIDGLAFGFPCNDFSQVGERLGFEGTFGPLYSYGVKALRMFQPAFFLAENVGGLSSNKEGNAFKQILADLRASGYKLTPHLYKFEQYGVPQARHRIIIVGVRQDLDLTFKVPSPAPYADVDVSARKALSDIPNSATHQERTRQSPTVVKRLNRIKPGENAFTADLPEELQIKTKTKISQIYRRLDPAKPSYTVTGSGGGGTHVYHWDEPRALTNRERARLQTFPDWFQFVGSKESVRKQIGMAVPVDGARVIFEAILKMFAGEDYAAVKSSFPVID